jgi:RNA polymerase sigma-70 factor (ECF subfamily)
VRVSGEQELIRRMLAGDERAFAAFFDAHFARLYRFALPRVGRDHETARDVVQATLTKAMRRLADFRGDAAVYTWLCQICRHEIADHVRGGRRHDELVVPYEDTPEVRAALESIEAPEEYEPDRTHGRGEVLATIRAILDRLPSRYGDALEWKYVEGRSVEEIGERLGIGHTAAQSLLARARLAFREAVESVCGQDAADLLASLR